VAISKQRKLLEEVQVGKGVTSVTETVNRPFINQLLRNEKKLNNKRDEKSLMLE
jgi:hypothetical protein